MKRWSAIVSYRSEHGPVSVDYEIEELGELPALVEYGPDWNAIIDIRVKLARATGEVTLTNADLIR